MEMRQTQKVENEQKASLSIASSLVSAMHEWLLIFMLFIDAIFSYLVTTFARYFRLQIPCLLCSRLDHILGKERPGFVWDLLCNKHKLKVSSLVFCKLHNNLVDVHGTCENCFFSSAETKNEPNAEKYRSLIGKFGNDPQHGLDDEYKLDSCNTRMCCCNELWVPRNLMPKFFGTKSTDSEKSESSKLYLPRNDDAGPLSHVEYAKLKVTSDTESETQISDNETGSTHIRELDMPEQDSAAAYGLPEPQITTVTVCPALEKSVEPDGAFSSGCNVKSKVPLGNGLEELNWHDKSYVNTPSDLISFTEAPPLLTVTGAHFEEPKETDYSRTSVLEQDAMVEHREISRMGNNSRDIADLLRENSVERGEISVIRSDPIAANETQMDPKPSTTDTILQIADSFELVDAYRLAVGARGRQLSGKFFEQQMSMKESKRASEDLKLLLSQISPSRGIELFLNDSPRMVHINNEDYVYMDAASSPSLGVQLLQRRISLERNESSLSLDGSTVSEIEGESLVDRLKRQVAHDKKIMGSLYKELEEERNASSVAANQTMAMITRLQEEKASIHMESSQYLRLMEEQAEYDSEAFQQVNGLLVEKEKRIQCLEEELEQFKNGSSNNFFKQSSIPDVVDQETEKNSILKSLKKLEEKLFVLSKDEVQPNANNCVFEEVDDMKFTQEPVGIGRKNDILESTFMNRDSELGSIRYELSVIRKRLEELDV